MYYHRCCQQGTTTINTINNRLKTINKTNSSLFHCTSTSASTSTSTYIRAKGAFQSHSFSSHSQSHFHFHSKKSNNYYQSFFKRIYNEIKSRPIQYATIPSIAAFVGISTNYMGVQMLFYPIEYLYLGTKEHCYSYRFLDDGNHTLVPLAITNKCCEPQQQKMIININILHMDSLAGRV